MKTIYHVTQFPNLRRIHEMGIIPGHKAQRHRKHVAAGSLKGCTYYFDYEADAMEFARQRIELFHHFDATILVLEVTDEVFAEMKFDWKMDVYWLQGSRLRNDAAPWRRDHWCG